MSLTDVLDWDVKNSGFKDNIQTGIGHAIGPVTTSTHSVQASKTEAWRAVSWSLAFTTISVTGWDKIFEVQVEKIIHFFLCLSNILQSISADF